MKQTSNTPKGVTTATAAEIKAANSLMVNMPESNDTKGATKKAAEITANNAAENSAIISATTLGRGVVMPIIRENSAIILDSLFDKIKAAGLLLDSNSEKAAIIEAAAAIVEKADTLEKVFNAINKAEKVTKHEAEKAAKKAAEKEARKAEKAEKAAVKKAAVNAAKSAAKLGREDWINKEAAEIAATLIECGIEPEIAAAKGREKAAAKYDSLCTLSTDCK